MFMLLGSVYLHDVDDVLMQLGLNPDAFMGTQVQHILLSTVFLALPGALAWTVDALWRRFPDSGTPPPRQLIPALSGASMAGGSPASSDDGAQARAISVLRAARSAATATATASARTDGEQGAAYSSAGQRPSRQLRPFVVIAYGYLPLVYCGTLAYYLDNAFEEAGLILPVAAATLGFDAPWLPTFVVDPVVTEFLQGSTLLFGAALSLVLTRKLVAQPWRNLVPQCLLIGAFTAELWSLIIPN